MTPDPDTIVIVSAYNEADRLGDTLAAVGRAFPGAQVLVADDGSKDETPHVALQAGAELVRSPRTIGKGGATTAAVERVLARAHEPDPPLFVFCDGDLGETAEQLPELARLARDDECDIAMGTFARRVGGGLGMAVNFSRWASRTLGGLELTTPLSGQRAIRGEVLPALLPFAPRFGMETGMNIDAGRAGFRVVEVELDLAHRATGKTLRGFIHRGRQLKDMSAAYLARR